LWTLAVTGIRADTSSPDPGRHRCNRGQNRAGLVTDVEAGWGAAAEERRYRAGADPGDRRTLAELRGARALRHAERGPHNLEAEPMKPIVANLRIDDMIAVATYLGTLTP
jgi:hypothetical protein